MCGLGVGKETHHTTALAVTGKTIFDKPMPHDERSLTTFFKKLARHGDETLTDLETLIGYDDDLRAEATRIAGRLHGLFVTVPPALERTVAHPRDRYQRFFLGPGGPQGCAVAGNASLGAPIGHTVSLLR